MKLYYMLDNHTFQPLPLEDPEKAVLLVKACCDEGQNSGMLFARPSGIYEPLHLTYKDSWQVTESKVRAWLWKASNPQMLEVLGMVES